MGTVQSRKDGQCTKMATVVPRNKDKRREDTKIEGPGSRRPRRPPCKDGTRTLDRSMSFKTGENREGRSSHSDTRTRSSHTARQGEPHG